MYLSIYLSIHLSISPFLYIYIYTHPLRGEPRATEIFQAAPSPPFDFPPIVHISYRGLLGTSKGKKKHTCAGNEIYMGLRCDDIWNCHLHSANAVSHVSPKTVATKSLLRISGQKWQLLEVLTIRMLEICFRALSQQVHILYKLGGPQSQCSLQSTTYKRFDAICKGSRFLHTNTIIYNTCYTNIMWHHGVSD